MTLLILFLASLGSSIISGLVGMAGGIILLAVLTFFYPLNVIIPLHGIIQLVSNFSRSFILRKSIRMTFFKWFILGSPFGALAGYFLLKSIKNPEWFLGIIAAMLFYVSLKPKKLPDIVIPTWSFCILGGVASFLGLLVGATGPLLAPFFVRKDISKEELVATKAACQTITHLFKIPVFLSLSFPYGDYLNSTLIMILGVLIGTKVGTILLKKISPKIFEIILKAILFMIGIRLCVKII